MPHLPWMESYFASLAPLRATVPPSGDLGTIHAVAAIDEGGDFL